MMDQVLEHEDGTYRRDHLRAVAQRVENFEREQDGESRSEKSQSDWLGTLPEGMG